MERDYITLYCSEKVLISLLDLSSLGYIGPFGFLLYVLQKVW